jgi:uncharacterized membrane protein (UPF0127 family)
MPFTFRHARFGQGPARKLRLPLILVLAAAMAPLPFMRVSEIAQAQEQTSTVRFETEPLILTTTDGKRHSLTVELALDTAQRAQGLMFRRTMAADHGMLFDFGTTRRVMMWMKNTFLPLDMLFVSKDGIVQSLHENAVPQSEAIIDSQVPVAYVLELNAGTIRQLSVTPGARLESAQISHRAKPVEAD